MLQAKLLRQMGCDCGRTVALGGVMTASQVSHTAFTRQMRLRLGQLPGEECVGPGGYGGLKVALRTTAAPRYFFYIFLRLIDKGYRPI